MAKCKIKVKMVLDTKGERGGSLFSPNIYSLNCKFAEGLIKKRRARLYDKDADTKRTVNLNGKEMIWGEYLKYRRSYGKTS